MRAYTEFLGKTSEQLIIEAENDIEDGKLMRKRKIFNELRSFQEFLEASNLAPTSVKARRNGVRSFYNYYNIQLPSLPKTTRVVMGLEENWAIPTKEDIQEILKVADPLEKALVLIGVSSGLSINEISNILIQQFLDGYDLETGITTLHMNRRKVGYEFYTFLTPEASKVVLDYLDFRDRTSDVKNRWIQEHLEKQKTGREDGKATGHLLIKRTVPAEYIETHNEKLRQLTANSIQNVYRKLNEKARKSSPSGKRNLIRSHNLRKFFNSTLLANHSELYFADFLMGHKINETHDPYYRADPNSLRDTYKKYIPYLTIQKELNVAESPEFKKLKDDNEVLARETARHIVERSELQELRKKVDDMNESQRLLQEYMQVLTETGKFEEFSNALSNKYKSSKSN